MKLKSILVKGPVDKKLTYKLCQSDPAVKRGVWEIAVSSVSFYFTSDMDRVVTVSSNCVETQETNDKGHNEVISSVLSVVLCSGKKKTRETILLPSQNFFELNSLHDNLEIYIRSVFSGQFVKGANAYVLLLLRKKA